MALDGEKDENGAAPPLPVADTDGLSPAGARRRRLAGLGASGVLMTLASQSAMAELVCKSPSAALSGSLASRTPEAVACMGRGPGFWQDNPGEWIGVAPTDMFSKHFSSGASTAFREATCMDILNCPDGEQGIVAMHIVATYLNVTSHRISFLTEESVLAMWREFLSTGAYKPAAGPVSWNGAALVLYLSGTQKPGEPGVARCPVEHGNKGKDKDNNRDKDKEKDDNRDKSKHG